MIDIKYDKLIGNIKIAQEQANADKRNTWLYIAVTGNIWWTVSEEAIPEDAIARMEISWSFNESA